MEKIENDVASSYTDETVEDIEEIEDVEEVADGDGSVSRSDTPASHPQH